MSLLGKVMKGNKIAMAGQAHTYTGCSSNASCSWNLPDIRCEGRIRARDK
jgi:hypothetical protein